VASDVASRGLDIRGLPYVVQYVSMVCSMLV
jgi:superfamily II DNA/RNA helicase